MSDVKVGMLLRSTKDPYEPILTVTTIYQDSFNYAHPPVATKLDMPDGSLQYHVTQSGTIFGRNGECDYEPVMPESPQGNRNSG